MIDFTLECCDNFNIIISDITKEDTVSIGPKQIETKTFTFNCYFFVYYMIRHANYTYNCDIKNYNFTYNDNNVDVNIIYNNFYEKIKDIKIDQITDIDDNQYDKLFGCINNDIDNDDILKKLKYINIELIKKKINNFINENNKENSSQTKLNEIVDKIYSLIEKNDEINKVIQKIEKCVQNKLEKDDKKIEEENKNKIIKYNNIFRAIEKNQTNVINNLNKKKQALDKILKTDFFKNKETLTLPKENDIKKNILNNNYNDIIEDYENIMGVSRVYIKSKNYNVKYVDTKDEKIIVTENNNKGIVSVNEICDNDKSSYYGEFNDVFVPTKEKNISNEEVFNGKPNKESESLSSLIDNMINVKYNTLFLSYGLSGSGKSYSLLGSIDNLYENKEQMDEAGISQYILQKILKQYKVKISAFQVYYGKIYKVNLNNNSQIKFYKVTAASKDKEKNILGDEFSKTYNNQLYIKIFDEKEELKTPQEYNIDSIINLFKNFTKWLDENNNNNNLKDLKIDLTIILKNIYKDLYNKIIMKFNLSTFEYLSPSDIPTFNNGLSKLKLNNKSIKTIEELLKKIYEYMYQTFKYYIVSLIEFDKDWLLENEINDINNYNDSITIELDQNFIPNIINNKFNEILKRINQCRFARGTSSNPDSSRSILFITMSAIDNNNNEQFKVTISDLFGREPAYEFSGVAEKEGYYIIDSLTQLQSIMISYKNFQLNDINNNKIKFLMPDLSNSLVLINANTNFKKIFENNNVSWNTLFKSNNNNNLPTSLDNAFILNYSIPTFVWNNYESDKNKYWKNPINDLYDNFDNFKKFINNDNYEPSNYMIKTVKTMKETMKFILGIPDNISDLTNIKFTKMVTFINTKTFKEQTSDVETICDATKATLLYGMELIDENNKIDSETGKLKQNFGKKKLKRKSKRTLKQKKKQKSKKKSKKTIKKRSLKKKKNKRSRRI